MIAKLLFIIFFLAVAFCGQEGNLSEKLKKKTHPKKTEFTFNDGNLVVKVPGNGNVPFYHLLVQKKEYFVKFMKLHEIEQKNGDKW